jgi:hypothetical protein
MDDIHVALADLLEILRIAVIGRVDVVGRGGVGGVAQDRLEFRRKRVVLLLVEDDPEVVGFLSKLLFA